MKKDPNESSNLDRVFSCQIPIDPTDEEALFDIDRLTRLANEGDAEAQYTLAMLYDNGLEQYEIAQDSVKALYWYKTAAESGFPEAMYTYGISLYYGESIGGKNIPPQPYEGIPWMKKGAEYGIGLAQTFMGMLYFDGVYVPNDDQKAIQWLKMAIEQGEPQAQYLLGWAYSEGRGVTKDLKKSIEWLDRAIEQGYEDARVLREALQSRKES